MSHIVTKARIRKVAVFTGTRAEYGLLYPVINALHRHPEFELQLYVSGAHLDAQYGATISEIERDGFPVAYALPLPGLGKDLALGCGTVIQTLGAFLQQAESRPDCVVVLGDRYETLGVAVATFLSNIPVAHIHGGDVVRGGMLDDPIRHAVTKLTHLHFPVTQASANRILGLGEEPWRVTVVGSPVMDNLLLLPTREKDFFVAEYDLDPGKPWILFTQHPISTQPELAGKQAAETLSALASFGETIQVVATYPNHDAGSPAIITLLEDDYKNLSSFRIVKSLGRERYLNFLRYTTAVVGNSSSGLLETAHFKVPCVNVGDRQKDRERGANVVDVPQDKSAIRQALEKILRDDAYREALRSGEHPFGQGQCAQRILEVFLRTPVNQDLLNKQITY